MKYKNNVVTNKITPKLHTTTKMYKVILNKGILKNFKLQNCKETFYDLPCHNKSQQLLLFYKI